MHAEHSAYGRQPARVPSAPDAALQLQSLLGHHSVLAVEMMRGRVRGDEDYAQAAYAAAGKNTDATAGLVESLFGPAPAGQFKTLWAGHVTALLDYARGVAHNDNAARDEATARLTAFERNLAEFFATASQGRLTPEAAQAAVLTHVGHLLHQADAYASKDYTRADDLYRLAYSHTFDMGRTLIAVLVPPGQAAGLDAPLWRLRSELSRLLGEHVVLVVAAARAGAANGGDFTAAAQTVDANTRDLAAAVDSLFGAAAATRFQALWADHIDQVLAYTAGVMTHDAKRREDAVATLNRFESQLAAFLDTATGGRLPSAALAKAILAHDQMLLAQIDALAAKQYRQANDGTYATYRHMSELAGQLAEAFGATVASRLPTGGPHTGYGGTADGAGSGTR